MAEERKFPRDTALILFSCAQLGAAIWWASDTNARLSIVEKQLSVYQADHTLINRLDERTGDMQNSLNEINRKLDMEKAR